jgi:hypothetical protein
MPTKKEIANLLFEELKGPMAELGFTGKKSDFSFKRNTDGWELEIVGDIVLFQFPVARFQFNASIIWIEKVLIEALPTRDSGDGYDYTFVFNDSQVPDSPVKAGDFEIQADDYFGIVAADFLELLTSAIIPMLDNSASPEKTDQLINKTPISTIPFFRFPFDQCLRGMIARALSHPEKISEVSEEYRSIARKAGRYQLKEFNQLYDYLLKKFDS